jgi:hypothetical protein
VSGRISGFGQVMVLDIDTGRMTHRVEVAPGIRTCIPVSYDTYDMMMILDDSRVMMYDDIRVMMYDDSVHTSINMISIVDNYIPRSIVSRCIVYVYKQISNSAYILSYYICSRRTRRVPYIRSIVGICTSSSLYIYMIDANGCIVMYNTRKIVRKVSSMYDQ